MKRFFTSLRGLEQFLILWSTQALSALGSAMTSFALVIWSYQREGSALTTALLSICSYAPYVALSIFAGSLGDRWDKRKTMAVCDGFAALTTLAALALLRTGRLEIWHLYLLNALNGLMNTVQQPVSDVAVTLLTPKGQAQRVGGLRALSSSLVALLAPALATAMLTLLGLEAVIAFDLLTCAAALLALALWIRLPEGVAPAERVSLGKSAREGVRWLRDHRGVLDLMLFLAAINLIASMYNAALPAMLLSRPGGGEAVLGAVELCTGLANLAVGLLAALLPAPKSRVRVICNCLLFSMSSENFFLALGRTPLVWCIGGVLGWIAIPLMSANLDAIMRLHVPEHMQGRVYSVRNSLQFFTIPIGYFLGGFLVDRVFEPIMAAQGPGSALTRLFGSGKGSGAAFLFFVLAFAGIGVCLYFRRNRHIWELERQES